MTANEDHRGGVFARDPHECAYRHIHQCGGRLTAEHVIPKAVITLNWRRAHGRSFAGKPLDRVPEDLRGLFTAPELEPVVADPRNGLVVCAKANLDRAGGMLRPTRELLPEHVEEFADAYGLEWYLEEHYGSR